MKLLEMNIGEGLSVWAFKQCEDGYSSDNIRKCITEDEWIFKYCWIIEDRKDMWSRIKDPIWAKYYCKCVKDRPEVRRYMK